MWQEKDEISRNMKRILPHTPFNLFLTLMERLKKMKAVLLFLLENIFKEEREGNYSIT